MVAEALPSVPAREEPDRKNRTTMVGGKSARKNEGSPIEEAPEVLMVPEKYKAPHTQVPFHEIGTQDCPRCRMA